MRTTRSLIIALVAVLTAAVAVPGAAGAKARDRDRDGMPDRWEQRHKLNPKKHDARRDSDRDGLRNLTEYRAHTDPRDRDSDDDGIRDGAEDRDRDGMPNRVEQSSGHDVADADSDDDGTKDGTELVGTVASFADGILTIRAADGTTIAAKVTDATEVECEERDDDGTAAATPTALRTGDDDADEAGDRDERVEAGDDRESSGDGDDHDGPGHGEDSDDDEDRCPVDALKAGAVVHEAELGMTPAGAVWTEIELLA